MNNEQKLIDIMFEVALTIQEYHGYFEMIGKEGTAKWVREQLSGCGFDTNPIGSSWGKLK